MELNPSLSAVNSQPLMIAAKERAPEPETVREGLDAAPAKPIVDGFFISPVIKLDNEALAVIFQFRDSESGEVEQQFPRESEVENRRSSPGDRTMQIPSDGQDVTSAGVFEAVGGNNGGTNASNALENDAVVSVGGAVVANGAPAVGGTAVGVSPALGPGSQGVNLLV